MKISPSFAEKFKTISMILVFSVIAIIGLASQLMANSDANNIELLKKQGYTSIEMGGYNFFCDEGTPQRRNFVAINPKGQKVEGALCAGRILLPDSIDTKIIEK
jgi:hypothetical protein